MDDRNLDAELNGLGARRLELRREIGLTAELERRLSGRDIFRVDLGAVVAKYVGETEKHLDRLFACAAEGGAVLLLDEADALFGKRSEVRDSHDRYANLDVSDLPQKIEELGGIAILTTNRRQNSDAAFRRRPRIVFDFPRREVP